jgi:chorismate mutase
MAEKRALTPKTGDEAAADRQETAVEVDAAELRARRDHVDDLRRRIDELDEALVRLLSARAACALEVGRAKKLLGLEIYQPSREAEVLAHVQRLNTGPLNDAAIKRLFERIIDEARRLEREADVQHGDDNAGGPAAQD